MRLAGLALAAGVAASVVVVTGAAGHGVRRGAGLPGDPGLRPDLVHHHRPQPAAARDGGRPGRGAAAPAGAEGRGRRGGRRRVDSGVSPDAPIAVAGTELAGVKQQRPSDYHGTAVAGLIAGKPRSPKDGGAVGIAPAAQIYDVRVYDSPDATGRQSRPVPDDRREPPRRPRRGDRGGPGSRHPDRQHVAGRPARRRDPGQGRAALGHGRRRGRADRQPRRAAGGHARASSRPTAPARTPPPTSTRPTTTTCSG